MYEIVSAATDITISGPPANITAVPLYATSTSIKELERLQSAYQCAKVATNLNSANNDILHLARSPYIINELPCQMETTKVLPVMNGVTTISDRNTSSRGTMAIATSSLVESADLINSANTTNDAEISISELVAVVNRSLAQGKCVRRQVAPQRALPVYRQALEDDLRYFLNAHVVRATKEYVEMSDVISAYQKFCTVNNLYYNYIIGDNIAITRDIGRINPVLKTTRKMTFGKQRRVLMDFRLHNTRDDELLTTATENLPVLPVVDRYEQNMRSLYESLKTPIISGSRDNNPELPTLSALVQNQEQYVAIIKAACGSGKTQLIKQIDPSKRILIVSSRRSLGRKQHDDFKRPGFDFKHYSEFRTPEIKNVKQLIVQIDSLSKVYGAYDILVLDEFTYLEAQLEKFTKRKKAVSCALFDYIKHTPQVIVADALITNETIDIFRNLRNDIIVYENTYPRQADKECVVIPDKGMFYFLIMEQLALNKKLVIPCGSKEEVEALNTEIATKFPTKSIKKYTSDDVIDKDVTTEWAQADVVIYTSVCEAGNSFVNEHFDACFGLFTANSFGPESALQMCLRARQLRSGKIYIHVDEKYKPDVPYYVETMNQYKEYVISDDEVARTSLCNVIEVSHITGTLNMNDSYFKLFCDVRFRAMLGKRHYLPQLLAFMKMQGIRFGGCITTPDTAKEEINSLKCEILGIKKYKRDEKFRCIAEAPIITYKMAEELAKNDSITMADKYTLQKFNIMRVYGITPITAVTTITPAFVKSVHKKFAEHRVVKLTERLQGEMTASEKYDRMAEIGAIMVHGEDETMHTSERLNNNERLKVYKRTMHIVNILREMGIKNWLTPSTMTEAEYDGKIMNALDYAIAYRHEVLDHVLGNIDIQHIKNALTLLGVKITNPKNGIVNISNYWKKDADGIIRPLRK